MYSKITTDNHTHQDLISNYLDNYYEEQIERSSQVHQNYEQLWREIKRTGSDGKRIRPLIVLSLYEGLGGKNLENIMPVAAALELLHTAILIHDDIIDRDDIRHGKKNVSGAYKDIYSTLIDDEAERHHFASSAAILAGDLVLSAAHLSIAKAGISESTRQNVFSLFDDAVFGVAGGELLDTESSFLPVGSIKSSTVMKYKTSSYSFVAPFLIAAELAETSDVVKSALVKLGDTLGAAFQLQDDFIGIFGDSSHTGKSTIGDLREGKRTLIIELFYKQASDQQINTFNKYFGSPKLDDEGAGILRSLLKESGVVKTVTGKLNELESQAKSIADEIEISKEGNEFLHKLIMMCIKRSK